MRRTHSKHEDPAIGFQIAPMIDVVFVIMLFFMVLAGDRQVEKDLAMTLPSEEQSESEVTPMEEQVAVDVDGEIAHNEEPVTVAELKRNFTRLAAQASGQRAHLLRLQLLRRPRGVLQRTDHEILEGVDVVGVDDLRIYPYGEHLAGGGHGHLHQAVARLPGHLGGGEFGLRCDELLLHLLRLLHQFI